MIEPFIQANWPAPACVKAYTSTRLSGCQRSHRDQLAHQLKLPNCPIWLNQVHGHTTLPAILENINQPADASFTHQANQPCVILTADCLPILLCNQTGTAVAAIHGGWRGLSQGIIQNTVNALNIPPETILAWLGPAISQPHYETSEEVRSIFIDSYPSTQKAFAPSKPQHWFADLYTIAREQCIQAGVRQITGGEYCTYRDSDHFFSYRREGAETGRMASVIWIDRD